MTLSADQHNPKALNYLGVIYEEGKYIKRDIVKAIKYYSMASNQGFPSSQYALGLIYLKGKFVKKDIGMAIKLLQLSAKKEFRDAQLSLAHLYLEGKYIKCDIEKAISLYKEVSSLNNQYAKNNLGVIYKKGFNENEKDVGRAIEYFKEAIRQKNDVISKYNLANVYLDIEDKNSENYKKSLSLLLESIEQGLSISQNLLCVLFIHKYGYIDFETERKSRYYDGSYTTFEIIEKELNVSSKESIELSVKICNQFEKMLENELKNFSFEEIFDFYRNADLIYTNEQVVSTTNFDDKPLINIEVGSIKNINELFYEGFGKDI